ncbi:MAG: dethiobiotin synthase [Gammaproteobacteria bacterium]|nr:dethiobiotin synthase [Gammaproteobacteria bacterium]
MKGLFVTGTDTNVGKTYIACQIASALKQKNINVIPRKPVETGCELINGVLLADDANLLLKASQSTSSLNDVCAYRFTQAISPKVAAKLSGEPLSLKQLNTACIKNISDNDFLLVEGAGGFYSPICENALNADLAGELNLPIILVAEDRVGAVNQVLLTIDAIEKYQLAICAIILNSTETKPQNKLSNNASEIKAITPHPVFSVAYKKPLSTDFLKHLRPYL